MVIVMFVQIWLYNPQVSIVSNFVIQNFENIDQCEKSKDKVNNEFKGYKDIKLSCVSLP